MNRKQEYLEDLDAALDRVCYEWVIASEGTITWTEAVEVLRNLADALEKEFNSGRTPRDFGDGQPDEAQEWHDFDPEA